MESVAAYTVLLIELIGDGVQISVVGHCLMEGCIEHTNLGNLGEQLADSVYTLQVCGVVQGSQVVAGCECLEYIGSEQYALVELLASVYHAVTYGVDLIK